MNIRHILRFALVLTLLLLRPPDAPAGRPGPAHRQPPQYRQANMLLLRFQDALAEERWADALALCSDRIRAKAAGWPAHKGAVIVIGHQPDLGRVAAKLAAGIDAEWSVKKGGLWWLSNRERGGEAQVVVRAVLAPEFL